MSRNGLYVLLGVLVAVVIGLGFYVYQEQQKPALEVRLDANGLTIDGH
jgi:predicted negative regulator of RcsB-dependent stress response